MANPGMPFLLPLAVAIGCASVPAPAPREPRPGDEEPTTWAESLDEAVFGVDEGAPRRHAFAAAPSHPEGRAAVLAARAAEHVRGGRLEEALPLLEAAAECAPPSGAWPYRRALADTLLGLRRSKEAADLYREIIREGNHPAAAALPGNLAAACLRSGDFPGAREAAAAALSIDPRHAEAMKTLGLADIAEGKVSSGESLLRQAIEIDDMIPEAQAALAEIEGASGRIPSALVRYRRLLLLAQAPGLEDRNRRWRDLFHPRTGSTAGEIEARIERLEAAMKQATGGGAGGSPALPGGQKEP